MQLSFYDASVACYQQILDSTANLLEKGQQHAEANDMALEEISNYRLQESMLPLASRLSRSGTTPLAPSQACARDSLCRLLINQVSTLRAFAG